MAVQIATRIIDGDGHLIEDMDGIMSHLPSPYKEIAKHGGGLFPPLDHLHSAKAMEVPPQRDGRPTNPGPEGWLDFLRDAGIEWTVLYPTNALAYGKIVSLDYAVAVCRAYNDWLYATYVKRDPRFRGMAIIPMQDPPEAAKELRRVVKELGFYGAMLPTNGLAQPLGSKQYWPVYEEANRLGCVLSIHGGCHDRFGMDHMNMYVPVHALGHPWGLTFNCANIIYNGIFDRFPKVRIAFLEGGIAWLLLLLERLHASHETHFQYIPPGEFGVREGEDPAKYIKDLIKNERFYMGIETEELTMPFALKIVGNKPFLYSSDFPHEVTLASCKHDIQELMESDEITADDKAALLWRNAETFYQLKP
jgi:predicted TIM-barrel fold metal-dependent hydrolase